MDTAHTSLQAKQPFQANPLHDDKEDDTGNTLQISEPPSDPTKDGMPTCIIQLQEGGNGSQLSRMRFMTKETESILSQIGEMPFAILCIAGEARQGKSYFLSCLIKYLHCLDRKKTPTIDLNSNTEMFHFQNGTERMTTGVWMWNRPFILQQQDGSEFALFIMDSQGLFDKWTGQREWNGLAGFSLLASSCLMYNTVHSLGENVLQLFSTFCETATRPLLSDDPDEPQIEGYFQKLIILIRDWGFPDTYDYGTADGDSYISWRLSTDRILNPNASAETLTSRALVRNTFKNINCCLLPSPGETAKKTEFQGRISELSPKFARKLRQFLEDLILPGGIPIKTGIHTNSPISRAQFLVLINKYVEAFNNNLNLVPENLSDVNIQASNEAALEDCLKYYRSEMENISFDTIASLDHLHEIQINVERQTIAKYKSIKKFGLSNTKNKYEEKLKSNIKAAYSMIKNNYKKSEIAKFAQIKNEVTCQFTQELDSFKKQINLNNFSEILTNLPAKYLNAFDESIKIARIQINEANRAQMEETFRFEAQSATERCKEISKEVEMAVHEAVTLFDKDVKSHISRIPKGIEHQNHEGLLKKFLQPVIQTHLLKFEKTLNELGISKESVTGTKEVFNYKIEGSLIQLQNEIDDTTHGLNKLIDNALDLLQKEITQFIDANLLKDDINAQFDDSFQQWYVAHRKLQIDSFDKTSQIDNAKTLAKFKKLLTSKLDAVYENSMKTCDDVRNVITKLCQNATAAVLDEGKKIIDPATLTKGTTETFEPFIKAQLDILQNAIEIAIANFNLDQLPTSPILNRTHDQWRVLLDQILQEMKMKLAEQNTKIDVATKNAVNFYRKQFETHGFRSTTDHEVGLREAIDNFKTATMGLSQIEVNIQEGILKTQLHEEWNKIQENVQNSIQAQRSHLKEQVDKLTADLDLALANNYPTTADSPGKIASWQEDELLQFATIKREKADADLRISAKKLHCSDSILSEFRGLLELEFDDVLNTCVLSNRNNQRTSEEFLRSTINKVIHILDDQHFDNSTQESEHILQKITNVVNLGNYAIDKSLILTEIQKQLNITKTSGTAHENYPSSSHSNPVLDQVEDMETSEYCTPEPQQIQTRSQTYAAIAKPTKPNPKGEIENIIDQFKETLTNLNPATADDAGLISAKQSVVDTFLEQFDDNDNLENLTEELNKLIKKHIEDFQRGVEQARIQEEQKVKKCFELYKNEIDKHRSNTASSQFLTPKDLFDFHTLSQAQTFSEFSGLSEENVDHVKSLIESHFQRLCLEYRENSELEPAIGIDLGTTFSCVAIFWEGQMTVIPNSIGKNTTPSYVAFKPDGTQLVGEPAKNQSFLDPGNTIFDAKRLIGRPFDDPWVQQDIKNWPFRVVKELDKPKIEVHGKTYYPEQIGAKVIVELKKVAESFLKRNVTNAVVTVPAYFNDGQRQATRDAGAMAGLNVIRIINEPTAAAFAYTLLDDPNIPQNRNILIYDFGGGTFDISILNMNRNQIRALAVDGDTHLGGEDLDTSIMEYCIKQFKSEHNVDLMRGREDDKDPILQAQIQRRQRRLRNVCELAKIALSEGHTVHINLDAIDGKLDLDVDLSRDQFEQINKHYFDKTITLVEKALQESKLRKEDIHEIVLVGGSTRIPKIQEMLTTYFSKPLSKSVNPDEAVACGAALQAAILTGNLETQLKSKKLNLGGRHRALVEMKVSDVTPYATGVELLDGSMSVIIPKSCPIPTKKTETYLTAYDNQTSVLIVIYEGEHPTAVSNHKVGEFYLNGIPPAKAEHQRIEVTMSINNEGILHVTGNCNYSGVVTELTVREHKGRISASEKKSLIEIK